MVLTFTGRHAMATKKKTKKSAKKSAKKTAKKPRKKTAKKKAAEEVRQEAHAERRVHEADAPRAAQLAAVVGLDADAAHRGHQEALGVHQAERPAGLPRTAARSTPTTSSARSSAARARSRCSTSRSWSTSTSAESSGPGRSRTEGAPAGAPFLLPSGRLSFPPYGRRIHLHDARPPEGRAPLARDPQGDLSLVLPRRQDRRARRQRRGQVHAAAHHGRRRQGFPRRRAPAPGHARSATCRRSRSSTRRRTCAATSRRRSPRSARCSTSSNEINARFAEPMDDDEMNRLLEKQGKVQERIDALGLWDLDHKIEIAMDALRLPPGDADVDQALRRRAAARGALPGAARAARHAAARRADQPPRRRERRVARAVPRGVHGHGRRRHPRPLLPRQRGRLDPRARPRRRASPGRGTTPPGSSRSSSGWRQEEKQASARQKTLERELEWVRMAPRARQAKSKARLTRYEELREEAERQTRGQRRDPDPGARRAWATRS